MGETIRTFLAGAAAIALLGACFGGGRGSEVGCTTDMGCNGDPVCDGGECTIFGDGTTSRDYSYVTNVVQANILAAAGKEPDAAGEVFNVAVGGRVSLEELYAKIYAGLRDRLRNPGSLKGRETPLRADFRPGDVLHSNADISKAVRMLGFAVTDDVPAGMAKTIDWYVSRAGA